MWRQPPAVPTRASLSVAETRILGVGHATPARGGDAIRLYVDASLAKHIEQRHFIGSPVGCAHRGSSCARKGAADKAIPALLLLRDKAVISLIVVWRMYCRDEAVKSLKDRLCGPDHPCGAGEGLLFQRHEVNEHVATEQCDKIVVTLLVM